VTDDERLVLTELDQMLTAGVLCAVEGGREIVVTEVVVPGLIELGFSRRGPCRYESHRSSDWAAPGGRKVCGVCHPPIAAPVPPPAPPIHDVVRPVGVEGDRGD
jgi:hypothetical protein